MKGRVAALLASLALAAGCSGLERGDRRDVPAGDGGLDLAGEVPDVDAEVLDVDGVDLVDPGDDRGPGWPDARDAGDAAAADLPVDAEDPCDDGDPCTMDLPAGADACTHAPHPDRTPCGDRRVCAQGACVDTCIAGPCPRGLGWFDGCRCAAPPGGLTTAQASDIESWTWCPGAGDVLGRQEACVTRGPALYRDLGDGTVVDGTTGLAWAKDLSPALDAGQADAWCKDGAPGLPGAGWRLPDARELLSVVHLGATGCPWWDPAFGTTCPEGERRLWTATPAGDGWYAVEDGRLARTGAGVAGRARCVRSGPRGEPPDRWLGPAGEGWFDRVTGLLWKAAPEAASSGWPEALGACAQWKAGRLPTAKEWATVADWADGACPRLAGPLAEASCGAATRYWSGTPWVAGGPSSALAWDVADGTMSAAALDEPLGAWCVVEPGWGLDPRVQPPEIAFRLQGGMNVLRAGGGSVAALAGGGWVVAWQAQLFDQEPTEAWAWRFDDDGRGTAVLDLFGMTHLDLFRPAVAARPDGGFTAVADFVSGGDRGAVRRGLAADLSAEQAMRMGPTDGWHQDVTVLAGERVLAAWDLGCNPLEAGACTWGDERRIEIQEIALPGVDGAGRFQATDPGPWRRARPALAWRAGGIAVAWLGPAPGGARDDVRYHLWDSSGTLGDPFVSGGPDRVANTWTGAPAEALAAASLPGGFVLAWSADGRDGSGHGVVVRRFGDDGEPRGDEVPVNAGTAGRQDRPALAATGDGGFLVAWETGCGVDPADEGPCGDAPDGSATAVQARRFGADGLPDGPEFRVNAWAPGLQSHPGVAVTPAGQAVVAWTSYALPTGRWDTFTRRLEDRCGDGADNDRDGVTDCADPDCAGRACPDDGDPCTTDRCDPVDGCAHGGVPGCRGAP